MSTADDDRGMRAVRRVRSVRETDSRIGLQQAVSERRAAGSRVSGLRGRLAAADDFTDGTTAAFLANRASLAALTSSLADAKRVWEISRTVTDAAQERWQADRSRLGAIDLLLERREEERRSERARQEARELDDLAAQRWLRATRAARAGEGEDR
jgi:flagellar export protein FliJ